MTTIIGLQKEDHCLLIADSRITDDSGRTYSHPSVPKITKRGKFLIAGAGLTQPCDIVQHIWKPPALTPTAHKDLYHFMIESVVPSLKVTLSTYGYVPDKDNTDQDFMFLIAINGTIFELDETLSVLLRDDGIYGIGSGASYAIGALQAGATWRKAMQIAAKNNIFTAAPFITHRQNK